MTFGNLRFILLTSLFQFADFWDLILHRISIPIN